MTTTLFKAAKIITMNPARPTGTHVAVRDGRVLGVGTPDELAGWGIDTVDESFAEKTLMPGLVEGHAHAMEGGVWNYIYVGYYDRRGPDGTLWRGLKSIDEIVTRLKFEETKLPTPDAPLIAWGLDPIYFYGPRVVARDLDRVSSTRPVLVMHASMHLANVNSVILRRAGITAQTPVEGIVLGADGEPTGELLEFAAMFLAYRVVGDDLFAVGQRKGSLRRFGRVAQLAGVTTVTDLVNDLTDTSVENMRKVTAEEDFPVRLVPAYNGFTGDIATGIERLRLLGPQSTDKLRFGMVKLVVDGSIQGFTARLLWPGYFNGKPNGLWVMAPQQVDEAVLAYHRAGLQIHIHTNGDEATEVALDAVERALIAHPRPDHRHTLQHCQMANRAQFRRMARLGLGVNLFANHLFYWGDAHYELTMGPERACRMDACAAALEHGVPLAIHSDAPITPIGPLFTAWCAVNRMSASGRRLGQNERIRVVDALRAITLGAAYSLRLDHEIGSIEAGKWADFCVLDDDPLTVAPEELKDVPVWGTVIGGEIFQAPRPDEG
jgi:predicted amidohydrolase YtcJ